MSPPPFLMGVRRTRKEERSPSAIGPSLQIRFGNKRRHRLFIATVHGRAHSYFGSGAFGAGAALWDLDRFLARRAISNGARSAKGNTELTLISQST
jgi:hypothetical protein